MKKIFRTLAIVAVAALGLTACENDINEQVNGNEGEKVTIEVVGNIADLTRSAFGTIDTENKTVPSTWSGNEQVGFSVLASTDKTEENEGTVVAATNAQAGATAEFSVELEVEADNTVFAVSPYYKPENKDYSKPGFSGITTKYQEFYVTIPAEQTPLANSVQEGVHLMAGEAIYNGGGVVNMTFNHIAAYGKMNIINFDGEIASVAITFPTNVVGESLYYIYAGDEKGTLTNTKSDTITLNPENVENNEFWFTLAPTGALNGDVKVVITDSEENTYTKTFNPAGNLAFVKGQVSNFTVNMNGIEEDGKDEPATYVDTINFAEQGYDNAQKLASAEAGSFVVNFTDGGTATAWYDSGSAVRVYAGGTFTVSSETTIVKIVLTYGSSDKTNAINTNVGTFSTNTWTGSSNSVTFTIGDSSGHRRIAQIEVHYAEKPVVKEASSLVFNATSVEVDLADYDGTFVAPSYTITPAGGELIWSSDNEDVATVAANGNVTIEGATGTATITATFAGNEEYKGCSAEYTISVVDTTPIVGSGVAIYTANFEESTGHRASSSQNSYSSNSYTTGGVQWSLDYADATTTGSPIGGSAHVIARVAKKTTNKPVVQSGNLVSSTTNISKVTFWSKAASNVTLKVYYSTDNSTWTALTYSKDTEVNATYGYSANVGLSSVSAFYLKFEYSVSSSTSGNRDSNLDNIIVYN